jgi:hypothetical protein
VRQAGFGRLKQRRRSPFAKSLRAGRTTMVGIHHQATKILPSAHPTCENLPETLRRLPPSKAPGDHLRSY